MCSCPDGAGSFLTCHNGFLTMYFQFYGTSNITENLSRPLPQPWPSDSTSEPSPKIFGNFRAPPCAHLLMAWDLSGPEAMDSFQCIFNVTGPQILPTTFPDPCPNPGSDSLAQTSPKIFGNFRAPPCAHVLMARDPS